MTTQPCYTRTKRTCYYANVVMAATAVLPSMLFITFRQMYGISFTLLGTLVLINFCTQLGMDLLFSFFSKHISFRLAVVLMPSFSVLGMSIYAVIPTLFPRHAYVGLVIGTVIFSMAAGLCEVLMSPLVAAMPSDRPERDMAILHSLYAYGVIFTVVISTLFFLCFGTENWMYLVGCFALLPLFAIVLFATAPLPSMNTEKEVQAHTQPVAWQGLALCVACIFFGSAAEVTMTNWVSGYLETTLKLSKQWCDLLGLAMFGALLALGRTLYAKFGTNIWRVLMMGMVGSVLCYVAVAICHAPILVVFFAMFTGFVTSMLWPGSLILMEEKYPHMGVMAYALMAAGGDLGGSVAPQLLGYVVDTVAGSQVGQRLAESITITPDQLGMKVGMLVTALFPLAGMVLLLMIRRYFRARDVASPIDISE